MGNPNSEQRVGCHELLTKEEIKQLNSKYPDKLYCHRCGNRKIVHEGLAEGYWCPKCGSSDQDE